MENISYDIRLYVILQLLLFKKNKKFIINGTESRPLKFIKYMNYYYNNKRKLEIFSTTL